MVKQNNYINQPIYLHHSTDFKVILYRKYFTHQDQTILELNILLKNEKITFYTDDFSGYFSNPRAIGCHF